jgi:hypothetical protein
MALKTKLHLDQAVQLKVVWPVTVVMAQMLAHRPLRLLRKCPTKTAVNFIGHCKLTSKQSNAVEDDELSGLGCG